MKPWESGAVILVEPQAVGDAIRECAQEIERLAACQKDADRYRWLREQHWSDDWVCVTYTHSVVLGCDCPSRERLDEVIDAAMKEQRT